MVIHPPKQPRNHRLTLTSSGLCYGIVTTAWIHTTERGNKIIAVKLHGQRSDIKIGVPEGLARLLFEWQRKSGEPAVTTRDQFMEWHAKRVCRFLQSRNVVVRVSHYLWDSGSQYWSHEVVQVL